MIFFIKICFGLVLYLSCKDTVSIIDFEKDNINYSWEVLPESTDLKDGGDQESRPEKVDIEVISNLNGELKFKAQKKGMYRLFAYADNEHGHAATGNIPFLVK